MLRLVGSSKTYLFSNNVIQNKTASILLHDPVIASKIRCNTKIHANFCTTPQSNTSSKKTDTTPQSNPERRFYSFRDKSRQHQPQDIKKGGQNKESIGSLITGFLKQTQKDAPQVQQPPNQNQKPQFNRNPNYQQRNPNNQQQNPNNQQQNPNQPQQKPQSFNKPTYGQNQQGFNKGNQNQQRFQQRPNQQQQQQGYNKNRPQQQQQQQQQFTKPKQVEPKAPPVPKDLVLPTIITAKNLSQLTGIRIVDVLKTMIRMGESPHSSVEPMTRDVAEIICQEYNVNLKKEDNPLDLKRRVLTNKETLPRRAPVVVVMGHINHGKTSLLDSLRDTTVVKDEAGGITQGITATQCALPSGARITFLDTPGHEAFTQMRVRGSQVTDIALLIVAADEGVQEQTLEAIKHIKESKVTPIVVLTKMDKPNANVERVKDQLAQYEVYTEDRGGEIVTVEVSAKAKTGLNELEDAIMLQSEVLDLRADPTGHGEATVVESNMFKGFGPTAKVVVRNGTIKPGDFFVVGMTYGKVRFINDQNGMPLKTAGPSTAVQLVGLKDLAEPGDDIIVVESEDKARAVANFRIKAKSHEDAKKLRLENLRRAKEEKDLKKQQDEGTVEVEEKKKPKKEVAVYIKADCNGSIEALQKTLQELPADDEISIRVVKTGVGTVSESDMLLAQTAKGAILAFGVPTVRSDLSTSVPIFASKIIYDILDQFKEYVTGFLTPHVSTNIKGIAQVMQIFPINKGKKVFQNIAGCKITKGSVHRNSIIQVMRDGNVVWEGKVGTLKHVKDDINEARTNTECGIALAGFEDLQVGDLLQSVDYLKTPRKLGSNLNAE